MGKYKVTILLFGVFFALCSMLELQVEARTSSSLDKEIEAKLKLLNKPAVKSIKSEDGDIIDCVNIYKQPAFDHPVLKNHTIKPIPSFLLDYEPSSVRGTPNASSQVFQLWQKSGSCPKDTVPIRRIQKKDLLRAYSLERFGRKPPYVHSTTNNTNPNFTNLGVTDDYINLQNRSNAYLSTYGYNFIGASASINIWNPNVEKKGDFTTAQIWLKANNGDNFESVEAGWMVHPELYGDFNSRLFAAWTRDSYHTTGCFDVTCAGFVHVGSSTALGATVGPYSSQFNQQYEIAIGIYWDEDGNWWLNIKNGTVIGYWPAELLGNLRHSATVVQWGGQVYSDKVKKAPPHTSTQMGSGDSADGRFGFACYMSNVRIKDYSGFHKYPEFVNTNADEPYCYNAINDVEYGKFPVFYFGGLGRKPPYCP
ncbi:unnamed protein product [Lathyrus oleraceus]|uniref:uncharacterized protein LOC127079013 n=1 Tax=Pisum sativum TaxID=3888 RepID=UPI001FC4C4FB|nr:uncharacterized protein LOC127079013 [Pisum sativum]